jgi:phage shock protein PspC (stress-responsive transcriptional regulator)
VASGLAHRWGVDPILVRGLFVVGSILLGVGLLVYGVLWLLLPEPDGRIHLEQALHGHWTGGMTGGLVATVVGLGGSRTGLAYEAGSSGPLWGMVWGVFWLAVAVLIVTSIVRSARTHRSGAGPLGTDRSGAGLSGAGPFAAAAPDPGRAPTLTHPARPGPGARTPPSWSVWRSSSPRCCWHSSSPATP